MTAYALLFTLAAIGISETTYLIKMRIRNQHPLCVVGGNSCRIVLESKYNHIFWIHNDVLGFLFYLILTIILGLIVVDVSPIETWELFARISIYFAAVFSVFLIYLQKFVIKSWCFWCLMSAITTWLMLIILLFIN